MSSKSMSRSRARKTKRRRNRPTTKKRTQRTKRTRRMKTRAQRRKFTRRRSKQRGGASQKELAELAESSRRVEDARLDLARDILQKDAGLRKQILKLDDITVKIERIQTVIENYRKDIKRLRSEMSSSKCDTADQGLIRKCTDDELEKMKSIEGLESAINDLRPERTSLAESQISLTRNVSIRSGELSISSAYDPLFQKYVKLSKIIDRDIEITSLKCELIYRLFIRRELSKLKDALGDDKDIQLMLDRINKSIAVVFDSNNRLLAPLIVKLQKMNDEELTMMIDGCNDRPFSKELLDFIDGYNRIKQAKEAEAQRVAEQEKYRVWEVKDAAGVRKGYTVKDMTTSDLAEGLDGYNVTTKALIKLLGKSGFTQFNTRYFQNELNALEKTEGGPEKINHALGITKQRSYTGPRGTVR